MERFSKIQKLLLVSAGLALLGNWFGGELGFLGNVAIIVAGWILIDVFIIEPI